MTDSQRILTIVFEAPANDATWDLLLLLSKRGIATTIQPEEVDGAPAPLTEEEQAVLRREWERHNLKKTKKAGKKKPKDGRTVGNRGRIEAFILDTLREKKTAQRGSLSDKGYSKSQIMSALTRMRRKGMLTFDRNNVWLDPHLTREGTER